MYSTFNLYYYCHTDHKRSIDIDYPYFVYDHFYSIFIHIIRMEMKFCRDKIQTIFKQIEETIFLWFCCILEYLRQNKIFTRCHFYVLILISNVTFSRYSRYLTQKKRSMPNRHSIQNFFDLYLLSALTNLIQVQSSSTNPESS